MRDLTAVVHGWFLEPYEGMGYRAEKRRWGTYWSQGQIYVADVKPEDVPAFLADVCDYYRDENAPGQEARINLDSLEADAALGPELLAAGCMRGTTQVFLAHDGVPPSCHDIGTLSSPNAELSDCPAVPGLTGELATVDNVGELAATKLRAFDENDAEPLAPRLAYETAQRRLELSGSANGVLVRIDDEPAGLVWWYVEDDADWIMLLGVRAPFRRRGIARWLLCQRIVGAKKRGKPLLINVLTENERAMRLYRSLGFTREVYWRYRYELML